VRVVTRRPRPPHNVSQRNPCGYELPGGMVPFLWLPRIDEGSHVGLPEPIVFREAHWTFHTADEIRRSLAKAGLEEITLTDPSYRGAIDVLGRRPQATR